MEEFFIAESTGEKLPLTTNIGAPLVHPGSRGPQTFEIINMGAIPLRISVKDLICIAQVFRLKQPSVAAQRNMSKGFTNQLASEILLGTEFF